MDVLIDHGASISFARTTVRPRLVEPGSRLGEAIGVDRVTAALELVELIHETGGGDDPVLEQRLHPRLRRPARDPQLPPFGARVGRQSRPERFAAGSARQHLEPEVAPLRACRGRDPVGAGGERVALAKHPAEADPVSPLAGRIDEAAKRASAAALAGALEAEGDVGRVRGPEAEHHSRPGPARRSGARRGRSPEPVVEAAGGQELRARRARARSQCRARRRL